MKLSVLVQWYFYKSFGLFPSLSEKIFWDKASIIISCPSQVLESMSEILNFSTYIVMKFGLDVELSKNHQLMRLGFLIFLQCHTWRGFKEDKTGV